MGWGNDYGDWAPYVPVAQRQSIAAKQAAQLAKKENRKPLPVKLEGRKIATTFWGQSWCDNLVAYSDFANRLPRGATYLRNGSVVDLVIKSGSIKAIVAGSMAYTVKITIGAVSKATWNNIKRECSASIESLLDLLSGRFSDGVMQRLTKKGEGLFPSPREIRMSCSCPDGSYCCKHIAAVMYGVGSRLDKQPELLFQLRDVDHQELVSAAVAEGNLERELSGGEDHSLAGVDLGALFGIEIDSATTSKKSARKKPEFARKKPVKSNTSKGTVTKATAKKPASKPAAAATAKPTDTAKPLKKKSATVPKPKKKAVTKKIAKPPTAEQTPPVKKVKSARATTAKRVRGVAAKKVSSKTNAGVTRGTK